MSATRLHAFIQLHSAAASAAAEPSAAAKPAQQHWTRRLTAWLIGGPVGAPVGGPVVTADSSGEIPLRYLANNHLRRDIGLPPVGPDGWPY